MGKITSLIEIKGKVGNLVGYTGKDGHNVVRKHNWSPKNAKSTLQMRRRTAWANLVNMWKAIAPYMVPSFEGKPQAQSDYNAFMQANIDIDPVFLKKKEARMGVCVAAPVTLCSGSLSPVSVSLMSGGKMRSDIALGDLTIDNETTVSAFSKAVINNNPAYEEGDQITGLLVNQVLEGENQIPRVQVNCTKIVLDNTSNALLLEEVSIDCFKSSDGYLSTNSTVNGGVAWVHSRIVDGKTVVSPAQLVVNNSLLDTYQSATAQNEAMASYGCKGSRYLTPGSKRYVAGASF